jgi:hypothetical protein
MSATFSGSPRLSVASPPFTALPISFGMWVKTFTIAAGNAALFSWYNDTANNSYGAYREGSAMTVWGGAVSTNVLTMVVGRWYYIVGRFITSSSKRLSALDELGAMVNIQNTDVTAFAAQHWDLGNEGPVGAVVNYLSGNMAEFWMTDTDIQPGGAALDNSMLRQLAYYGPFSIPLVRSNLVHYRSFRSVTDDGIEKPSEVFHGKYGRLSWGMTTGLTTGGHPPIYGGYEPGRRSRRVIPF